MADPVTKFIVHQEQLQSTEASYLNDNSTLTSVGFTPNTAAYASQVNAMLHETSLFVTAFANNMTGANAITPSDTTANVTARLTSYLQDVARATLVNEAASVTHELGFSVNGASREYFNGSSDKDIPTFYAPTSGATRANQLLISDSSSSHLPTWTSGLIGGATTPLYVNGNGEITSCDQYAGGTRLNVNGDAYTSSATIYAATAVGTSGQVLISSGSAAPTWTNQSSLQVASANTAGKVANSLKITFNGTDITFDGNAAQTVSFFAASTRPNEYQVLAGSTGNNSLPAWTYPSLTLNKAIDNGYAFLGRQVDGINVDGYTDDPTDIISHTYHDFIYETENGTPYLRYNSAISCNQNEYKTTGCQFRWLRWNFTSGPSKPMTLTIAGNGNTTLDVNGAITATGNVTGATFVATSDARLKENVVDYVPSKSILNLPVKEFDLKVDKSHHIGCLAQDLQEIAPELVHEDANGYLSIEETKIVYLLLDEIKKLRHEVDELKKGSK